MPRLKMKDSEILEYFRACKTECEDETKEIRSVWDSLLDQYLCKKDFSKKKNWQFKVYTPISKPVIKKAVRLIKQVLVSAGDYFDFDTSGQTEEKIKLCNITKRALKVYLNGAGFLEHLATALESGFTLSLMILKFYVADEKDHFVIESGSDAKEDEELVWNSRLKLKVKPINPFNFYFTKDNSINIEDEWITLPQLREMVDNSPEDDDGNKLYNKKTLNQILKDDYATDAKRSDEDTDRLLRLGIMESSNCFRKDVLVSHFWGPLINKDNKILKKHCNFIIINDKHILLNPRKNPYWHGKSPYVYDSPLKVLFRHIGKGLTEDIMSLEDAIVDFVNLQLDNLMWQLLGIREVDELAFSNTSKAELRELYPGKLIKKRTGYQGDAFKFHDMGVNPDKAMGVLNELKFFSENDHGVTEYVKAMAGGNDTATEYSGKRQSAMNDFQSIARDIENSFIVECIDRARDLMVQYLTDFEDDEKILSAIQTEFKSDKAVIASLSETQKRQLVVTDVEFIARGISIYFERQNLLEKLGAYVKMLNALPDGKAKMYPKYINILRRINNAFAFDKPDELINTDEEVQKEIAESEQRQQKQQQAQIQAMTQQAQMAHKQEMEKITTKIQGDLRETMLKIQADQKSNMTGMKMKLLEDVMGD